MGKRPDLESLVVPKGDPVPEVATVVGQVAEGAPRGGYNHTLSLRLTAEQYRRLRLYARDQEDLGRGRVTHQAIIEEALMRLLNEAGR
jgi:hypothetical protein